MILDAPVGYDPEKNLVYAPPTWWLPPPGVHRRHDGSGRVWRFARGSAVASTPALVDEPTELLPVVAVVPAAEVPGRHAAYPDTPARHRASLLVEETQAIDMDALYAEMDHFDQAGSR